MVLGCRDEGHIAVECGIEHERRRVLRVGRGSIATGASIRHTGKNAYAREFTTIRSTARKRIREWWVKRVEREE